MGQATARIAREDLLTPPEFRDITPVGSPAARVGGARIELIEYVGETRLGTCYQQVPVRLLPPLQIGSEPASLVYLINLTAGLLDGDGHRIEVTARAGTCAVVTGQSATRIHPSVSSFSTQQWEVGVEDDACLVILPGPVIPFRGCRYYQRGRVSVAPRARLVWGDIWLPGRYLRGELSERFVFETVIQELEIERAGRLVYRDRFRWDGPWTTRDAHWYLGGSLAAASLFFTGPPTGTFPEAPAGVRRSIFPLDSGDTCVRWCGPPGPVTFDLVAMAMRQAADWTGGPDTPPWLIESSDLAPTHWFSLPPVNGHSSGHEPPSVVV